jgi:histidine decarboxylase
MRMFTDQAHKNKQHDNRLINTIHNTMREVACFLSPSVYKANYPSFVEGLRKNGIEVECFDARDPTSSYETKVIEHNRRLAGQEGYFCQQILPLQQDDETHPASPPQYYNFLCLAFEDSRLGIRAARKAGMCVFGIGCNDIELEQLKAQGAYAVAPSVSEMLQKFHIRNYYQIQYLPYAIYLQVFKKKVGYPASLLDTLSGRFVKNDPCLGELEDDDEDLITDSDLVQNEGEYQVVLDFNSHRIIPRDVLGIEPGSLADVYINNIGWPADIVPTYRFHTRGLEMDIIRMFEKFYRAPVGTMRGFVTSGGTEGNFAGMWWQRDYLRKQANGQRPILLTSRQSHYSVRKAAQQLDIQVVFISTLASGEIDCADFQRVLEDTVQRFPKQPIMMVVNAGTTQTGAIDNIPKIHSILREKVPTCFSIHLDAALMGAVLPIINPFGLDVDYFRDLDVKTIAISGHKFFGSVTICGLLLTTSSFLDDCFDPKDVGVNYVSGLHDITPSGSRNGFHVVSFHNTICGLYMHTDCRRLKAVVRQCYHNAEIFLARMAALVGSDKVIRPDFSLQICFPRPSKSMMIKYSLMPITPPIENGVRYAGVCILINVTTQRIDEFLKDYALDKEVQEHLLLPAK